MVIADLTCIVCMQDGPVKGYRRAGQMPGYSHHYPGGGTSHADQASREPAKCRAGRSQ